MLPFLVNLIFSNSIGNTGIEDLGKAILNLRSLKKIWLGLYE